MASINIPEVKWSWSLARQIFFTILVTYVAAIYFLHWTPPVWIAGWMDPITVLTMAVIAWEFFGKKKAA